MILEDIAPPPRERLGALQCPCHRVPTRSSPSAVWAVHTGVRLETSVLGRTCRCWVRDVGASRSRWRSAQNIGVGSYPIRILAILPGVFHVRGGCQRWDSPVVLVLCFPCFDVLCTPTSLDKTRGGARFEVGCPHSQGLSWSAFWSIWRSRWFSRFSTSVRIRVRVCWPSTDRWWVLTALGAVSRPFSRRSRSWETLTDLGDVVAALLAG